MIYVDTSVKKLEVVLGAAKTTNDMHVVCGYYDVPRRTFDSTGEFLGGSYETNTNGTTAVTIVAAPNSGAVRNIVYISVNNNDTAAKTVTIQMDNNGTDYKIISKSLAAGETLVFLNDAGWQVI